MIIIYKEFVKNNIDKLTISHLEKFAQKNHIEYTQYDLIIIYNFIKNNYNELLDGNTEVFNKIRGKIDDKLYDKLLNIFTSYNDYILIS